MLQKNETASQLSPQLGEGAEGLNSIILDPPYNVK